MLSITAADLTPADRVLLFCLASQTDWSTLSVSHAARHLLMLKMIERDPTFLTRYVLTDQGREVLAALLRGFSRS